MRSWGGMSTNELMCVLDSILFTEREKRFQGYEDILIHRK